MPKLAPWVPTMPEFIEGFFEFGPLSSFDVVYDLGCGDGRLLFAALEKGAGRCVGIDIDPEKIREAKELAGENKVEERVAFIEGDFLEQDFSDATVIFCYLFPEAMNALRPKFEKELRPGTRIISEVFSVLKWKETETKTVNQKRFHLYIMPPETEE